MKFLYKNERQREREYHEHIVSVMCLGNEHLLHNERESP